MESTQDSVVLDYKVVIQNSPTAFFVADENGRYVDVNPAACELLGYDRLELLTLRIPDILCAEDRHGVMVQFMSLSSGVSHKLQTRLLCKDGIMVWVSIHAFKLSETRYAAFCEDITDQLTVNRTLQESEEVLRELFDNISDGIAIYEVVNDGENFAVKNINKSGLKIAGVDCAEHVVGQCVTDAFPGVREMGLFAVFQNVWQHGQPCHFPFSQYKDDKVEIWADNYVFKLPSGEVVAVYQDLTEQKRNEDERAALQHQLLQAQKLDAIGRLAGGIAHDFNNLLHVLRGYLDMMEDCVDEGSEGERYLEVMGKVSSKAEILVSQLLAYSRKQIMKMQNANLNEIAQSFVRLVERIIGEGISLKFSPDRTISGVHVDIGQIEQVFMNLCVNARDAMPEGGMLSIQTGELFADAEFCQNHFWAKEQSYVHITFCDTGTGIAEDMQSKIFEPFFTTKEVGKGSGLGLSMVLGIIKQHDGGIDIRSNVGEGTSVRIYLPAAAAIADDPQQDIRVKQAAKGSESILLAEDDEMVRDIGQQSLRSSGYRVITACDGEDALRKFRENMEDIDLVILDVVMPKLNGREVFKAIRELKPDIRVLFNSGYSLNTFDVKNAFGDEPIIQKPYSRATLLRAIRDLLDR